jgi:hypothetical protein
MFQTLKNVIIKIYSNIIILELFIRQKLFRQNFIYRLGGFGDLLFFIYYGKKYIPDLKFLNLGSVQDLVLNLCLKKDKVLNIIFKIPSWKIYYKIFSEVTKSKIVQKTDYDAYKLLSIKNTNKIKNEILNNAEKNIQTSEFLYLKNELSKKYICFYVKSPVEKKFNWLDFNKFNVGYSSEKEKIVKLIKIIINFGFNILVLGEKNEPGIDYLYKKLKFSSLFNNKIYFLKNFVNTADIKSKINLYNNSYGYIGNGSGHAEYFYFLRKKTIIFDYLEHCRPNDRNYKILKSMEFRRYLFKKLYCKKTKRILTREHCDKIVSNLINTQDFCGIESLRNFYKYRYKLLSTDINVIKKEISIFFKNNDK